MNLEISGHESVKAEIPNIEYFLSQITQYILNDFNFNDSEISLSFCDDQTMKQINLQYRNINKTTDVLSFREAESDAEEEAFFLTESGFLGDILISYETALKQSEEFKTSFAEEIGRLSIHGILHLLDIDHERSKEEEIQMEKLTEKYLQQFRRIISSDDS